MPRISKYGDYYLTSHLATGGMAELFRAHKVGEAGFEKTFALKRLLPHLARNQDFVTMFLDEARLASQLNHQNIVQVYELGRVPAGPEVDPLAGDTYFIAMEYVFGKNLAEIFRAGQEQGMMLSGDNLVKVVLSVAVALDYAHSLTDHSLRPLGVVHRDISPANILLSYEGEIKLVDFGIAKALSQSSATKPGVLKGKFAYMSPEQAKGQPVDNRSDIFSLGIVLWEGLTGHRLFAADNEAAILKKVVEADPQPPSQAGGEASPRLDAICLKCLAHDREARYQSAQELAQDLEDYLRSLSTYPSTYSLRNHLYTIFSQRIDQEREDIRQENETLRSMLAGQAAGRGEDAATQRSHPIYSPPPPPPPPSPAGPVASAPTTSRPHLGAAPGAPPPGPAPQSVPRPQAPPVAARGGGRLKLYLAGAAALALLLVSLVFWPRDKGPAPAPAPASPPATKAAPIPPPAAQPAPPPVNQPLPPPAAPVAAYEAQRNQALSHLQAGRHQEAWDILRGLAAAEPWRASQLVADQLAALLGMAKAQMEASPAAALAWLERARELAPESAEVYFQAGRAYTKLERLEEALTSYRRAVELAPHLAGAYFNMGYILLRLERVALAVSAFQRVVELGGELVEDAYTNLGVCHARLGDREKAAAMFRQALARNPGNALAQRYLEQVGGGAGR